MTIIDFTAQMVPIGVGLVAFLAMAAGGIAASADDREREALRAQARQLGAWWLGRGATGATSVDAPDDRQFRRSDSVRTRHAAACG